VTSHAPILTSALAGVHAEASLGAEAIIIAAPICSASVAPMNAIERIYREWDERLSKNDAEGVVALYAPDALFESPLVPHLMNTEHGVLHGHGELRPFFRKLAQRKPEVRRRYRTGYLTDGRTLIWEYPREAPGGDQMDFAEVMEIDGGLIQRHRVYWGWFGVRVLQTDAYHR
jgi:hypothetical protein